MNTNTTTLIHRIEPSDTPSFTAAFPNGDVYGISLPKCCDDPECPNRAIAQIMAPADQPLILTAGQRRHMNRFLSGDKSIRQLFDKIQIFAIETTSLQEFVDYVCNSNLNPEPVRP